MNKNIIIIFLLLIIIGYSLIKHAKDTYGYNIVSSKLSPNGQYTIFEFESISEGGHAPYGQGLTLTNKSNIKNPEDGYVIFAGYCKSLTYSWKTSHNIQIICEDNKSSFITQANKAYGINIEVLNNKKTDIITNRSNKNMLPTPHLNFGIFKSSDSTVEF